MLLFCLIIFYINLALARNEDNIQEEKILPYHFSYELNDPDHHQFRIEENDNEKIKGAYGYRRPSGEYSIVDFLINKRSNLNEYEKPKDIRFFNSDVAKKTENEKNSELKIDEKQDMMKKEMQHPEDLKSDEIEMEEIEREEVTTSSMVSSPKSTILMKLSQMMKKSAQSEREEANLNSVRQSMDEDRYQNEKISIHQLIGEAMPNLQMSIVPIHFLNRMTGSLISVPYLVMKSIYKLPLLPGSIYSINDDNHHFFKSTHFPVFKTISSKPFGYNELAPNKKKQSEKYFRSESSYPNWLTLNTK